MCVLFFNGTHKTRALVAVPALGDPRGRAAAHFLLYFVPQTSVKKNYLKNGGHELPKWRSPGILGEDFIDLCSMWIPCWHHFGSPWPPAKITESVYLSLVLRFWPPLDRMLFQGLSWTSPFHTFYRFWGCPCSALVAQGPPREPTSGPTREPKSINILEQIMRKTLSLS